MSEIGCLSCLQSVRTEGLNSIGELLKALQGVTCAGPQRKGLIPPATNEQEGERVFGAKGIRHSQLYLLAELLVKPLPRIKVQGKERHGCRELRGWRSGPAVEPMRLAGRTHRQACRFLGAHQRSDARGGGEPRK